MPDAKWSAKFSASTIDEAIVTTYGLVSVDSSYRSGKVLLPSERVGSLERDLPLVRESTEPRRPSSPLGCQDPFASNNV